MPTVDSPDTLNEAMLDSNPDTPIPYEELRKSVADAKAGQKYLYRFQMRNESFQRVNFGTVRTEQTKKNVVMDLVDEVGIPQGAETVPDKSAMAVDSFVVYELRRVTDDFVKDWILQKRMGDKAQQLTPARPSVSKRKSRRLVYDSPPPFWTHATPGYGVEVNR